MSANPDTVVGTVLDQVDHDPDQACQRLLSLLDIPSISTQSEHESEVQQAAAWPLWHAGAAYPVLRALRCAAAGSAPHAILLGELAENR